MSNITSVRISEDRAMLSGPKVSLLLLSLILFMTTYGKIIVDSCRISFSLRSVLHFSLFEISGR